MIQDWAHWLPLAIGAPILGGVVTPALAAKDRRIAPWWALFILSVTLVATVMLAVRLAREGPFSYAMGGWAPPWGIELRFDEFSAFAVGIALVGWLAVAFSHRHSVKAVAPERLPYYHALILLNLGGMIGFVSTGDFFNLFVFLEVLSLSAYALVAVGERKIAGLAAFKYLLLGTLSSLMVLLCVGLLHALTGSLNMADVASRLGAVESPIPVVLALGGFTAAFLVKAALFPLHIWLPDAHAAAPSPVSAILSGLVVKMGIVGLLRVWQVFHGAGGLETTALNEVLLWLGAASIVMGAFFAVFQEDLKLMLAYSTVSNMGYIVLGLALASPMGMTGGAVHVLNHALIKATLFLAAGALIHATGERTLEGLRGVGRSMPVTCLALSVGVLAIIGVPPTAGFLGKWYIALGALEAGRPFFAFVIVFGALLICIYYARIVNAFYFRAATRTPVEEAREVPLSMLLPVLVLAALCLMMGILGRIPLSFAEAGVLRMLGS